MTQILLPGFSRLWTTIEGIVGGQGKIIMLTLFERSLQQGTEAFYRMSNFNFVGKLLQFQFRKFDRISHKFPDKNQIIGYFMQNDSGPSILFQNG